MPSPDGKVPAGSPGGAFPWLVTRENKDINATLDNSSADAANTDGRTTNATNMDIDGDKVNVSNNDQSSLLPLVESVLGQHLAATAATKRAEAATTVADTDATTEAVPADASATTGTTTATAALDIVSKDSIATGTAATTTQSKVAAKTTTTTVAPAASPSSPLVPPPRSAGKRPSPWREPRLDHQLPPPAKDIVVDHSKKSDAPEASMSIQDTERIARRAARKQQHLYGKLFSDAIVVHIPLSVTADMGAVLHQQRTKRVAALLEHFPPLQVEMATATTTAASQSNSTPASNGEEDDDCMDEDEARSSGANGANEDKRSNKNDASATAASPPRKLPKLKHVPQPHEYASVIDYLEAKYVQGVVVHDDDDDDVEPNQSAGPKTGNDDEEGDGSVYSESSFLDDSGLRRTVAEQVLGHQTTTKMELMGTNHDDDGFFVNVGDLEVEETEMTKEGYDPLDDTKRRGQGNTPKKKARKRKQSTTPTAASTSAPASPASSKQTAKEPHKKKKAKTSDASSKSGAATAPASPKKEDRPAAAAVKPEKKADKKADAASKNPAVILLREESQARKQEVDAVYAELVTHIKGFTEEELPRKPKPKKVRVIVSIPLEQPKGKDTLIFAHPFVPGTRLTAKIPPGLKPGDTFKVTVKQPAEKEEDGGDDDPNKDYNKLSREFYDKLEDYSRVYDEWCDAEGVYRKALGGQGDKYQPHLAKREKFDKLVAEFPKDMKTVADKDYLKKVLRRARQNKHKREQTLARQLKLGGSSSSLAQQHQRDDGDDNDDEDDDSDAPGSGDEEKSKVSLPAPPALKKAAPAIKRPKMRTIVLPRMVAQFPAKAFCKEDFKDKALKPPPAVEQPAA